MLEKIIDRSGDVLRALVLGAIAGMLYWTYVDFWDIDWIIPYYLVFTALVTVSWYYDIISSLKVFKGGILRLAKIIFPIAIVTVIISALIDRYSWLIPLMSRSVVTYVISTVPIGAIISVYTLQILAIHTIVKRVYNSPKYILLDYILAFFNLNLIIFGVWFYQSEIEKHKMRLRQGGFAAELDEIGKDGTD